MSIWNVNLRHRSKIIQVQKVLKKGPDFLLILDDRGKQHELSVADFLSFEWERIMVGSIITLTISESVRKWNVKAPKFEERVKNLVLETKEKVSGLFFLWVCQRCGTTGYVEYEDGDDPRGIVVKINIAHHDDKEAKPPDCECHLKIFDHRGMEMKDSELFLSSAIISKVA